jgi:flagellar biosynthesis protein FlhG
MTPEPTSRADAYAAVKLLHTEHGVDHFRIVVNLTPTVREARLTFERLAHTAERYLGLSLDWAGCVFTDECVGRAVRARRLVVDAWPNAPASQCIAVLARTLMEGRPSDALGRRLFWRALVASQGRGGRTRQASQP